LQAVWDERYQRRFGFWRLYVTDVIQRYLDCGDLHLGKINDVVIENMMNWHHSEFNVYCGKAIWPHNEVRLRRRKFSMWNLSAGRGSSGLNFRRNA
jgi:hypothetical protein